MKHGCETTPELLYNWTGMSSKENFKCSEWKVGRHMRKFMEEN